MEKFSSLRKLDFLMGGLICGLVALAIGRFAVGQAWRTWVPLVFVAVLSGVAVLFGTRAGILGSVLSALVFAAFLFSPVGSIHVTSEAARSNLGWMLLIGVSFSLLFAPPRSGGLHRH